MTQGRSEGRGPVRTWVSGQELRLSKSVRAKGGSEGVETCIWGLRDKLWVLDAAFPDPLIYQEPPGLLLPRLDSRSRRGGRKYL